MRAAAEIFLDARIVMRWCHLAFIAGPAVEALTGAWVLGCVGAAAVGATDNPNAAIGLAVIAGPAGVAVARGRGSALSSLQQSRGRYPIVSRLAFTVAATVMRHAGVVGVTGVVTVGGVPALFAVAVATVGVAEAAATAVGGRLAGVQVDALPGRDFAVVAGVAAVALAGTVAVLVGDDLAVPVAALKVAAFVVDVAAIARPARVADTLGSHAKLAVWVTVDTLAVAAAVFLAALVEQLALGAVPSREMRCRVDGLVCKIAVAVPNAAARVDTVTVLRAGHVAAGRIVGLALGAAIAGVADARARVVRVLVLVRAGARLGGARWRRRGNLAVALAAAVLDAVGSRLVAVLAFAGVVYAGHRHEAVIVRAVETRFADAVRRMLRHRGAIVGIELASAVGSAGEG